MKFELTQFSLGYLRELHSYSPDNTSKFHNSGRGSPPLKVDMGDLFKVNNLADFSLGSYKINSDKE